MEIVKEGQLVNIILKNKSNVIGRVEHVQVEIGKDNILVTVIDIATFDNNIFEAKHFKGFSKYSTDEIQKYEVLEDYYDVNPYELPKDGKYFSADDRVFICDEFEDSFTNLDGEKIEGTITGASVLIAAVFTNSKTNEPIYFDVEESSLGTIFFDATVDSKLGVLVISDKEQISRLEVEKNYNIACKITGYSFEVKTAPYCSESNPVSEEEFRRIVTENFGKFNNSNNYYGQNTAYVPYKVEKKHPRTSYEVGWNNDIPAYRKFQDTSVVFTHFYSSAKTEEKAKEYVEMLSQYKTYADFNTP